MFEDNDIKIVGSKPSETVKQNSRKVSDIVTNSVNKELGKKIGKAIAAEYIGASNMNLADNGEDKFLVMQRMLLLSFTVTVGLEKYCADDDVVGIAQKAFLEAVHSASEELFSYSSDTGAFSFYYLAYRRGTDVVRRIGQTFAMLCSHDGDPIYQELGETLYCWFMSVVEKTVTKAKNG